MALTEIKSNLVLRIESPEGEINISTFEGGFISF